VLDWSAEQFRAVGRKDARGLAITLFAGVQGAALLADTLGDPKIMRDEARRLESWIDQLSA
jgi:TetR/AcrR family transcriptional regulator, transcriptional repressor for nem operon